MSELEPISISPPFDRPRHAHQEIADLLAAALLRLHARLPSHIPQNRDNVYLGFPEQQRVNANPDDYHGVRQ